MNPGRRLLGFGTAGPADLAGPAALLDNAEVLARLPRLASSFEPDEVARRFGVERRQWARGTDVDDSALGAEAARRALDAADVAPADLALLVTATSTPGRATASLAGRLAKRLGLTCPAFDVRAGGAAGLFAWQAAERWLGPGEGPALVVAAEVISPWLDLDDDSPTALLFGDGAGALLLGPGPPGDGSMAFVARTSSPAGRPFTVPGRLPPGATDAPLRFQAADRTYAAALEAEREDIARELVRTLDDDALDLALPFAPSARSAARQARALGVPPERTLACLADWGCPGAAAPTIALAEAAAHGLLAAPRTLALTAVGGGVHSAAMAWRHTPLAPARP